MNLKCVMPKKGIGSGSVLSALVCAAALVWGALPMMAQSTVEFVPGTFRGLIQAGSLNDESFGFFVFSLTRSGTFSGRFTYGKNVYPLRGRFNADGSYSYEHPDYNTHLARPRFINLQLSPADGSSDVNGTITDLTHNATVNGERTRVYTLNDPAPYAGYYTFCIRPPNQAGAPEGSGFGRVSVDRYGHIVVGGIMAGGRPFSQATTLAEGGRWEMYARLSGNAGLISGSMTFRDLSGSDFDGTITWLGPEEPFANEVVRAYVNNFAVNAAVAGSAYRYLPGNPVLNVDFTAPNAQLTFAGGAIDTSVSRSITISPRNLVSFEPRSPGDAMAISPGTGFFAGTFFANGTSLARFRGAILQKQNIGVGYFNESGQVGNVTLR